MSAVDDTVLVLSGVGIPDFSARGVTQTLTSIEAAGSLRRTINGALVDLSFDQFHKFKSTISCADHQPPAIDGVWPGRTVTVGCISELCYPAGGTPSRPAVFGTVRVAGGFSFYRPQLDMMVVSFTAQTDEWGAVVQWQMDLEET